MLPKNNRITHRKDFEKIFKEGKGFFTKVMGIKFINNSLEESRFGIIISNKISKKAVIRNKLKRQIREIIHADLEKIKTGIDVSIICQPGIEKLEYEEIKAEIIKILQKIQVIEK